MQTDSLTPRQPGLNHLNLVRTGVERQLPWISLGIVALLGLIHLPFPLNGDQAFFTLAAREMASGEILYRDFWDLKQPGIFVFYYLATRLFGSDEVGIHSLEWLVLVGFSGLLLVLLRPHFHRPVPLALVPLLTVGLYYSVAPSLFLTQVEALVGVPIFGVIWCFQRALHSARPRYCRSWLFIAGTLGAVVLFLKLLFLIVLAPIGLFSLFKIARHRLAKQLDKQIKQVECHLETSSFFEFQQTGLMMVLLSIPLILGVLLPWLAMFVYFSAQNSFFIVYETFFVYPRLIVASSAEKDWFQFAKSLGFFGVAFFPSVVLGGVQVYQTLRRESDLLMVNLAIWVVVGLMTIWLQSQAWWPYYYLLLFVPLGILAAHFLDRRWDSLQRIWDGTRRQRFRRFVLIALVGSLWLTPLAGIGIKSFLLVRSGLALSPASQLEYQTRIRKQYSEALDEVAVIDSPAGSAIANSDSIFVMGDPLIYYFSNRRQAGAISGWALEYLLESQWRELGQQLATQRPVYIFIVSYYRRLVEKKGPEVFTLIEQHYTKLRQSEIGTWYVDSSLL